MYIVTNEQMRKADAYTIETLGAPSLQLMERAGRALAQAAEKLYEYGRVLCVCGGGNNGGDGFVCARVLNACGIPTEVVFFAQRISQDCQNKRQEYLLAGGKELNAVPVGQEYALVVDCLVGTGLQGGLTGKNAQAVVAINALKAQGAKILSADIPSGLCSNGIALGVCVQADQTLCIGEIKTGVVLGDGLDFAGKVFRADIGITLPQDEYAVWIDGAFVNGVLPKRKRNSHKGSYGKTAIVAGSEQYTGAAFLSATACLRSGVGYTTLCVPKNILPYYLLKAPEVLLKSTNDGGRYEFNQEFMQTLLSFDCVGYGMGMQDTEEVAKGAVWLLENYAGKLVLDADGLNALAKYRKEEMPTLLQNAKCAVVMTPHIKEFSRLSGQSVQDILQSPIEICRQFALQNRVCVALKSASTIVTDGSQVLINTTGNSGQAKGGSGDVLSGVMAGLCAQGATVLHGASAASYLVGKSAEIAVIGKSEYTICATDIIESLGEAFATL